MFICFVGFSEVRDAYNEVTCVAKDYRGPTRFVILQPFDYLFQELMARRLFQSRATYKTPASQNEEAAADPNDQALRAIIIIMSSLF